MEETIQYLLEYGYIIIFLYSLGGGFVALLAGSVVAYTEKMDIFLVIFVASLANFVGSQLLFFFARYQRADVYRFLQKHRRKIALVRMWLSRYGVSVIFIQKYIYAIKTFIPLVMGVSQYSCIKFSFFNFIASFVWGACIGASAYLLGRVFIDAFYMLQEHSYLFPLFGITLLAILYVFISRLSHKKIKDNL